MENKHCIFPFRYTNRLGTTAVYTNCTNTDRNYFGRNNQAWCATAVDEEATGISASYTTGGMTFKIHRNTADDVTNTVSNESEHTEIGVTFAF